MVGSRARKLQIGESNILQGTKGVRVLDSGTLQKGQKFQILLFWCLGLRRKGKDLTSPLLKRNVQSFGGLLGAIWLTLLVQALLGRSVFQWDPLFSSIESVLSLTLFGLMIRSITVNAGLNEKMSNTPSKP